ncbi:hypothetical protein Pst134EA_025529 [Puccinia striiformis f. sp. tritici]|uniref:hypothetical protein n=2 Tax=Puccinia striiformis f. sp. tritici TaxID=168172 RepID=UPI002007A69A|nr:hypothetical protein Pst134EA_025529 [Puccinia striiformis f. sp. tritici]KAH9451582.1 hypothetical protein Pst134EA_025529 [Puccinia striiformis f. sp. tritici]KAI9627263.1 hypothetical protein KEM48_009888 [Puccinia striiformis f. sp. tritici PST-130]
MRLVDQAVDRSPRWLRSGFRDTRVGSGSFKKVLLFDIVIPNSCIPSFVHFVLLDPQLPSPHTRTVSKMLFSIQQKTASALGLAIAVSAAPLNDRSKLNMFERGIGLGWLCHFDGIAAPTVDASLNLPLMLGGLCAKVNYDYEGCNSFKPIGKGGNGGPVHAQSVDNDADDGQDDHAKPKPAHHKKPKHHAQDPDSSVGAQSFNDADGNGSNDPSPNGKDNSPSSHHKKPKHHGEDSDGSVGAQSFNDAGDNDQPKRNHHSSHPSSVGALGEGNDDPERCNRNEHYSSQLHKCVNKSFYSKPNEDSTCKNGKLDALLKLCLDVSVLGLTKPIHAEATVLPFGPGRNGKDGCPVGQQLSSLLNTCVDKKFFSGPLADNQCQQGWKLDLVLGTCLNLIGCQNQGLDN